MNEYLKIPRYRNLFEMIIRDLKIRKFEYFEIKIKSERDFEYFNISIFERFNWYAWKFSSNLNVWIPWYLYIWMFQHLYQYFDIWIFQQSDIEEEGKPSSRKPPSRRCAESILLRNQIPLTYESKFPNFDYRGSYWNNDIYDDCTIVMENTTRAFRTM